MQRRPLLLTCALLLTAGLSGCGWWGEDDEQDFDDNLPELGAAVEAKHSEPQETPDDTESPASEEPATALVAGSEVPLRKTVIETLSAGGKETRTELTIDLRLSIEEVLQGGRRRLVVHYERVRYSGEVGGEQFRYDSAEASKPVPPQAAVYHGLAGNDFSIWTGPDGEPSLVGFDRFLRRCVQHLPRSTRRAVLDDLLLATDAERIAKFVDSTFGLLPPKSSETDAGDTLQAGHQWTAQREVGGPVPMTLLNQYTVADVDENRVAIEIRGTVGPAVPEIQPAAHEEGIGLRARGGRTTGHCTVDRGTGIPLTAKVERDIEMEVIMPDGARVDQTKRVVTTLESLGSDN